MDEGDPPPELSPDELPSSSEMAKIARELLRERAKDDPALAKEMQKRGIKNA